MITRLYLMRHATAVPHGTTGFAQDALRPLTEEGYQEARSVARGLMRLKIRPEHCLTSPYLRARQTAEEVSGMLTPHAALHELPSLRSEADPQETSAALKPYAAAGHILCVGHEPHLSAWIAQLVDADGAMRCLMKKAGVACVEVVKMPPPRGNGRLRWLMSPKQLALIGKSG